MTDLLRQIEEDYKKREVPDFQPGDTVRVGVRITESSGNEQRVRIQPFEGVVIARDGGGLDETFTVRRVTHGVGVERTFPLHSPTVDSIEVIRHGNPRRVKLYYLRQRIGRGARVRERDQRPPRAGAQGQVEE
ncbi:MAG: 50S ribosomal protein L19 [Armatimonadota bacterium]